MADVFAGCLLERVPSAKALARLPFFELAPRPPLPSLATLARIKKQAPAWPQVSLVAPRSTWLTPQGAMRPGPELDAGLDWIKRASDILASFAIVLATGAELSTGGRDRERLAAFLDKLRPTGRTLVIAPRGLWEPEHAAPFAAEHGAVYGFDPLEHDAPEGALVYARVRPMGARPRLTEGHIAQIAERIVAAGAERAYIGIESDQCSRAAKRLLAQVQELDELPDEDEDDEDESDDDEDEESDDEED
ncbi:MAG: hypothetical protein ABW252_02360 [Polyangiales bacterium]